MSGNLFAKVIIDIDHEKVDRMFSYRIPEALRDSIGIGSCVEVPFGKGNTLRQAYVTELSDESDYAPDKLKEISGISDGELPAQARNIELAWWMKNRYGSTMITALKTVLPVKRQVKGRVSRQVSLLIGEEQARSLSKEAFLKNMRARARLLDALIGVESVDYAMLTGRLAISPQTIRSMEKQGILKIEAFENYRNPIRFKESLKEAKQLTKPQQAIVDDYLQKYDRGERRPALLFGITGSGKTEVYMQLIEGMLQRGKDVIVLIPEIALTYQTVKRFYRRFGDIISILNSRLSAGEKYDQLRRVEEGKVRIMIGPRSALFTPFANLGMVIIDEEHETSYKSETMPRYHAREVAEKLCEMTGATLFLGSATPSIESFRKSETGEYLYYELTERIGQAVLPRVQVVDLRKELAEGNFSVFSKALKEAMDQRLARGQQIMLFLNRRGVSGFVSCKSCGKVLKCPHCDVSLSEHRDRMVCHYCGYESPKATACPVCGSRYIYGFRAGTQQIEEKLQKMYPTARILRMDADTTRKKDDYDRILSAFSSREADILIGTQMIVKGHDFPAVTLVGILAADLSLFASDFNSSERTFQLLTQAIGRAGRGELEGEALIQTYQPEHFAVRMAAAQDYKGFYEEEIQDRELMHFPPIWHLLAVLVLDEDEGKCERYAAWLTKGTWQRHAGEEGLLQLGPAPATIGRIRDRYRRVVYFKSRSMELLVTLKNEMEKRMLTAGEAAKDISVFFDFDPMSGY